MNKKRVDIPAAQFINPGIFECNDARRKELLRFKEAVDRGGFMDDEQKKLWKMMGYMLSNSQLAQATQIIVTENLKQLSTKEKLEALKPVNFKKAA